MFGCFSRNCTVYGPVLTTPSGPIIEAGSAPRACESFTDRYCLMLATTSSAFSVLPLWNLTPRRIWNVQTVRALFGFQLVASHGLTWSLLFVYVRYSPGMPARPSDPASLSPYGSRLEL